MAGLLHGVLWIAEPVPGCAGVWWQGQHYEHYNNLKNKCHLSPFCFLPFKGATVVPHFHEFSSCLCLSVPILGVGVGLTFLQHVFSSF